MVLLLVAVALQDGPMQDLFSREPYGVRTRSALTPRADSDVEDRDADFGMVQHEAFAAVHVWGDGSQDVSVFGSARLLSIDTQALLEDTREEFPDELWDLQGGVTYRHILEGGQILGGRLSVGSASDEPFADSDVTTFSASGFLRLPAAERDSWLFFVAMSNNSTFVNWVPIPGFAYVWVPSDEFRATIGLPFVQAEWKPLQEVSISGSYAPLHNARLAATWQATEEVQVQFTAHWATQSWLRENRPDDEDRLYYDEKRFTAGVRWTPVKNLTLHASFGAAMDRTWNEGEDAEDDDAFNEVELEAGAFAAIGVDWTLGTGTPDTAKR